jgi:hypothetical protein
MPVDPANFINILLAFAALSLYAIGSRRFYLDRQPFLIFLGLAILIDAMTAVLASFGITPTTQLPYSDFVPWKSKLFLTHIFLATVGFFGFIAVTATLMVKGTRRPYPRMRNMQYKVLLPIWLVGEGIALVNSLIKVLFKFRIYDYF